MELVQDRFVRQADLVPQDRLGDMCASVIGVGAMLQFGIVGSGLLGTRPQAEVSSVLEVTFNALTTERVLPLGQNDRADDLMAGNLRSQKRSPVRELRVREFHELVARSQLCPFILHDGPAFGPDGPASFPGAR